MKAALLYARLDSSRLPHKALIEIAGKKMVEYSIDALKSNANFQLILATTDRQIDAPLADLAREHAIPCFRGEFENVAARTVGCIHNFGITAFARANGDSPFVKSKLIADAFDKLEREKLDFVTNLLPRTFPYGISIEVFDAKVFLNSYPKMANDPYFTEHASSYFYQNSHQFRFYNYTLPENLYHKDVRLTIDTQEDIVNFNLLLREFPDILNWEIAEIAASFNKIITKHD